jgi:hypothetical protein
MPGPYEPLYVHCRRNVSLREDVFGRRVTTPPAINFPHASHGRTLTLARDILVPKYGSRSDTDFSGVVRTIGINILNRTT